MEKMNIIVRRAIMVLILSCFISSSMAFEPSQLQWEQGGIYILQRGEVINTMGYSLRVISFPSPVVSDRYRNAPEEPVEPFVGLNISKNGNFLDISVLRQGESYITPEGDLRITAKKLPAKNSTDWLFENYSPWAELELSKRGDPDIKLSIDSDDTNYLSSTATEIVTSVILENDGSADAFDVEMVIDTELPIKKGSLKYHYEKLKAGESIIETVTFSTPIISKQKTYSISARVTGNDIMSSSYTAEDQIQISITVEPVVMLSIRKTSSIAKMYLKDYAMLSLYLKNNGKYDLRNMIVTDSIPEGFSIVGNHSLHWNLDIPAGGEWDYRYLVKPLEPNKEGVSFPPATAEFSADNEFYSIRSSQPKIVVYGPKIMLKKMTDVPEIDPGDIVTVTVIAENTGSTPTKVFINDTIPDGVTFISGMTMKEEYLEANNAVNFSYTLQINSGEPVRLPHATAEYYELGTIGEKLTTVSQEPEIGIKPTPTPTPEVVIEEIINVDFTQETAANPGNINETNISITKTPPIGFDIFWSYFAAVLTIFAFMISVLLVTYYRQGFGI